MFGEALQPWHLIVLGVVVFLLFGARRLPELGKGLGEGLKGFREGIKGITDPPPAAPVQAVATPAAPQSGAPSLADYRCPSCKALVKASAPKSEAGDDFGFCPECGNKFDKKSSLL